MWASLAEELAQFSLDVLDDNGIGIDASGGQYEPDVTDTAAGTASNTPPDDYRNRRERPSNNPPPHDHPNNDHPPAEPPRSDTEPTNDSRVKDMWESIVIDGILGILGNIALGPVTEGVSVGSSAGEALGKGVIEIERNYHEGMGAPTGLGGSTESGREIWDAIDAENRREPWPRRRR